MKRNIIIIFSSIIFSCSNESKLKPNTLESYLVNNFNYVAKIDSFYIAAGNRRPKETDAPSATGKDVFEMSVRIFESLLDQNEDGVIDNPALVESLASNLMFLIDHTDVTNIEEEKIQTLYGNYVMTMKSNIWPYMPSFHYSDCDLGISSLNTSLWRPETYNALWEECFHTITEAQNRISPDFSFTPNSILGGYMQSDINAGTYDISEQNELEDDGYDFITGVNEYMHQIWLINLCGSKNILNEYQLEVLAHFSNLGIPLSINTDYNLELAEIIK